MAEIKIEKKKPVWPWILLGLIILGIILYFVFADNDNDEIDMEDDNTEQIDTTYSSTQMGDETSEMEGTAMMGDTANASSVSYYIAHVGDQSRMGIDHEYTNNALIHLINAVDAKAEELNVNIDADLQEIRNDAQQITQDPMATNHADKIKTAGTKIATVLEKLQTEKFPDLSNDVTEVKTAAENIQPTVLTLEQKDPINSFFKEAADVLQKMS